MVTIKKLISIAGILLVIGLLGSTIAQQTPADTEITNQASATFIDSAGEERSTTSNQVLTIVQQVFGVSVSPAATLSGDGLSLTAPGQTRTFAAGANAYFNYLITNTGNGRDTIVLATAQPGASALTGLSSNFTYSDRTIYHDINCNGTVDTGEAASPASGSLSIELNAQETGCAVVGGGVPTDATGSSDLDLTATPSNNAGTTVENNWARGTVSTGAVFDLRLDVSPTGGVVSNGAATLVYTFSGSNVSSVRAEEVAGVVTLDGTPTEGILLTNVIPDDTTYNATSASGTSGVGSVDAIFYYTPDGGAAGWYTAEPGVSDGAVERVGLLLYSGTRSDFFTGNASFNFSYTVTVAGGLSPEDAIRNAGGTLTYGDGTTTSTLDSNEVVNSIQATYQPLLSAGTTLNGLSTGSLAVFPHTLTNSGTAIDSFSLRVLEDGQGSLPEGWICGFRFADAETPLPAVVGPLAASETFDFTLVCRLPQAVTSTTGATLEITATSTADSSKTATATDTVGALTAGYDVTVTSTDLALDTANSNTAEVAVAPGENKVIPFEVTNSGPQSDVYNLSSTLTPANGITVSFFQAAEGGANGDCATTSNGIATTKTELLPANDTACFVAVASIPATASAAAVSTLKVLATSTTDATVSDFVHGDLTVSTVEGVILDPDRAGTITTPGTITYKLNLRNTGNNSASIVVSDPGSSYGWLYQYSTDGTSWSGSPFTAAGVAARSTQVLHVRVVVPAGQPTGRVENMLVTATSGGATETATLTTTIVAGDLILEKSARVCADATCTADPAYASDTTFAQPGQYIEYKLLATNIGTGTIGEVIIMEPLPNFTQFVSAKAETTGAGKVVFSDDLDNDWTDVTADVDGFYNVDDQVFTSVSTGDSLYFGLDTTGEDPAVVSGADQLLPAETITIYFVVKVK